MLHHNMHVVLKSIQLDRYHSQTNLTGILIKGVALQTTEFKLGKFYEDMKGLFTSFVIYINTGPYFLFWSANKHQNT